MDKLLKLLNDTTLVIPTLINFSISLLSFCIRYNWGIWAKKHKDISEKTKRAVMNGLTFISIIFFIFTCVLFINYCRQLIGYSDFLHYSAESKSNSIDTFSAENSFKQASKIRTPNNIKAIELCVQIFKSNKLPNNIVDISIQYNCINAEDISSIEKEVVTRLYDAFLNDDKNAIARILYNNNSELTALTNNTLKGGLYLYNGENFFDTPNGKGMVLKAPDRAFFGEFKNGLPYGPTIGVAINWIDSSEVYHEICYDYIDASFWNNGKANGKGETGEVYLTDEGIEINKFNGIFIKDAFDKNVIWTEIYSYYEYPEDSTNMSIELNYDNGNLILSDWTLLGNEYVYKNNNEFSLLSTGTWCIQGINLCPWY